MTSKPSFNSLLNALNDKQKEAVSAVEGKILVLAGAGSGKTRVLTYRMAHMILSMGIDPRTILALTFTNKAANEMKERMLSLIGGGEAKAPYLMTFHSLCLMLLKEEGHNLGFTKNFSLYDEQDMKRLFQGLIKEELEHEGELPSYEDAKKKVRDAMQKGLQEEEIPKGNNPWHDELVRSLFRKTRRSLQAFNAMDFDSMLTLTKELFVRFPSVLEKVQNRFHYVLIDEYQDTNPIQFQLTEMITRQRGNLCVVGDDDQSIYAFRGADPTNITRFQADRIIKLEQNYRSTNLILQAANSVIAKNKERLQKNLWSQDQEKIPIEVFHAPNEEMEAQAILYRLTFLREKYGFKWSDFAVLYRSNQQARVFETAFLKHVYFEHGTFKKAVPYQVFGGSEFYDRKEIKDLLAYLKALVNDQDDHALLRIINYPRRGISDQTVHEITSYQRQGRLSLMQAAAQVYKNEGEVTVSERARASLGTFFELMEKGRQLFQTETLRIALPKWIDLIGLRKGIWDEVKSETMREMKWKNVLEMVDTLSSDEISMETLASKVRDIPLHQGFERRDKKRGADAVSLMTIHSAKGLEFKAVFLAGCEERLLPHERSLVEKGGIEEERRLFYVAVTRAKKHLCLSMTSSRKKHGKDHPTKPSPFLYEIPKEFLQVSKWDERSPSKKEERLASCS